MDMPPDTTQPPAGGCRTIAEVIDRLAAIAAKLPADDGIAAFDRMYLTVTESVDERVAAGGYFADDATMAALDVRFANLYLAAADSAAGGPVPAAWAPLVEHRADPHVFPVQFALAGMNAHINHDLPIAVVDTCLARRRRPDDLHADYLLVNELLADVERQVRASFLAGPAAELDVAADPAVHAVSCFDIDVARDVAWGNALVLWQLRDLGPLRATFLDGLARTVGLAGRALLVPSR